MIDCTLVPVQSRLLQALRGAYVRRKPLLTARRSPALTFGRFMPNFTKREADLMNTAVTVLVIDDSNTIRRSAEAFLRQAGFNVVLAEDGFDALAKITDHHPEVIFVDIMMPRLDGYQTCALIKQNPVYKSTPVIMLSSKDGIFDRARGKLAGSDQYLTKPFTKDGLVEAVHRHVPRVTT